MATPRRGGRHPPLPHADRIELVVARHGEDLSWTRNLPAGVRTTVYDKRGDLAPEAWPHLALRRLENVGAEAHTYLHHLLRRHDSLAPLTVFCQGHPFDHAHDLHRVVRQLAAGDLEVQDFLWLGFIIDTDDPRGRRLFVPWSKNRDGRELGIDEFHLRLFGEPAPPALRFYPGAQFVVARERAAARGRDFYARALELAGSFPDAAHCFERTWDRVFGVRGVDLASMGGEATRYLKRIRRLE